MERGQLATVAIRSADGRRTAKIRSQIDIEEAVATVGEFMIAMVAVRAAVPADASDSSYERQQHVDGSHGGDPGVAGLSEFYDRRPGLKAKISDLGTEIVKENAMLTRLHFYNYMVHVRMFSVFLPKFPKNSFQKCSRTHEGK